MALGSLIVKIVGDTTQFNKSIAATQKQLDKSTKGLMTVGKNMTSVGDSMVKGITVPLLAVGAGLLKLGEEFDGAYDKIRIGTGKTGAELESLNDDFRAVAKVAPSAFGDIGAAISGYSKTLGLTGKPLQDLSTQILNLSRLTKTDLNTNIDQSSKLFNNWKISTENQGKTLDILFRASQNANISVTDLMAGVADSGPILRTMGYDLETSTALIAGFDKAGVDVTSTVAGMKKALVTMAKEGMGDPQEVLAMYIDKIKGAKTEVEAIGIAAELFGTRSGAQMAIAIREGRLNLDDLIASLKTGTDTINDASAATMDWQEKLVLLKGNLALAVKPLANKVFESLGRTIGDMAPKVAKLAESFGTLSPEMQDSVIAWGLLTAGAPLLISALGRTLTGVIALRNGIALLNTVTVGGGLGNLLICLPQIALAAGLVTLQSNDMNSAFIGSEAVLKKLSETSTGVTRYFNANHFADISKALSGGLNPKILALNDAYVKGTLSLEAYTRALSDQTGKATVADDWGAKRYEFLTEEQKIIDSITNGTYELTAATNDNTDTTMEAIVAATDHENKIAALAATYPKLTAEQLEEKLASDEAAASLDNQTQSVDELIASLYKLYNLNQSVTEANWSYEDSLKNLTEVMANANSTEREKQTALFATQDALENLQIAMAKEYSDTETTIARKKELAQEYITTGLKAVESGAMSEGAFILMASTFGLTSADIIKYADLMGIKLDKETQPRLINISINLDDREFYIKVGAVQRKINEIGTGYMAALGYAKGGIVGYAKGGIISGIRSASAGMVTPSFDNGGILSMLHKNEVVLNAGQTQNLAKLIFGLANTKSNTGQATSSQGSQEITLHNTINLDGKVAYENWEKHNLRETARRV